MLSSFSTWSYYLNCFSTWYVRLLLVTYKKKKKKKKSKVRVPQDMVMGQCVQRVNEAAKRQGRASLETVPRVGVSALAFRGIQ